MALTLTDKITFIYLTLVEILIIIGAQNPIHYKANILFHLTFIFGIYIFILILEQISSENFYNKLSTPYKPITHKILSFILLIRNWYPLIIVSFLYKQTGYLNQIFFEGFWDKYFYTLEEELFGLDIGITLLTLTKNNFLLNEIMYLSYFSYYLIIPLLGFILYKKGRVIFHKFLFSLMLTYYICYILYIFIPLAGPFEIKHFPINGGLFKDIISFFYKHGELPGSAMPSSHVAIALIVLIYSKITKNLFPLFLTIFILLSISTFFLRFHYILDILGGIFIGFLSFYISRLLIKKFKLQLG